MPHSQELHPAPDLARPVTYLATLIFLKCRQCGRVCVACNQHQAHNSVFTLIVVLMVSVFYSDIISWHHLENLGK